MNLAAYFAFICLCIGVACVTTVFVKHNVDRIIPKGTGEDRLVLRGDEVQALVLLLDRLHTEEQGLGGVPIKMLRAALPRIERSANGGDPK